MVDTYVNGYLRIVDNLFDDVEHGFPELSGRLGIARGMFETKRRSNKVEAMNWVHEQVADIPLQVLAESSTDDFRALLVEQPLFKEIQDAVGDIEDDDVEHLRAYIQNLVLVKHSLDTIPPETLESLGAEIEAEVERIKNEILKKHQEMLTDNDETTAE